MNKRFNCFAILLIFIFILTGCANVLNNMLNQIQGEKAESIKKELIESISSQMIQIPNTEYKLLKTEVTQKMYEAVMGENPSYFEGEDLPVECVSWYDAIYFCNKLSMLSGLTPVYSVNGQSDISEWGYTPHNENSLYGTITQNIYANGYRLPTVEEWLYAAKGGKDYTYSGSNTISSIGWYYNNSDYKTHEVAKKDANNYGFYDMTGNVYELCWDSYDGSNKFACGGSWYCYSSECELIDLVYLLTKIRDNEVGFRIICNNTNNEVIEEIRSAMIEIPNKDYKVLKTEITQKMYTGIMGENPSYFRGEELPVEQVSLYDAIYFCNKLSISSGLTPVYAVDGKTDITQWNYTLHGGYSISGTITQNTYANGYRLPTVEEWQYAAKADENYSYAGSNNVANVAWYKNNSNSTTHEVKKKLANGFGLYDMTGNVSEWCWDIEDDNSDFGQCCGGSWVSSFYECDILRPIDNLVADSDYTIGFRVVCNK